MINSQRAAFVRRALLLKSLWIYSASAQWHALALIRMRGRVFLSFLAFSEYINLMGGASYIYMASSPLSPNIISRKPEVGAWKCEIIMAH